MRQGTILIVDDNRNILTSVKMLLENTFEHIVTIAKPENIPARLREDKPDVVLLDMNFRSGINNGNEGLFWLHEIKKARPATEVVLFTAYADIELAVRGIKEGATDFVVKPFDNDKLTETLVGACRKTRKEPSSVINSNARLNRKSPTSTVAGLPKIMLAAALPRLSSLPSTTSS